MTVPPQHDKPPTSQLRHGGVILALASVGAVVAVGLLIDDAFEEPAPIVGAPPSASPEPSSSTPLRRGDPTYSNVYKYDYVGPMACRDCHPAMFERWRGHPHARMNQNATAASVVGAFDGRELTYGRAEVAFDKVAGDYVMTVREDGERLRRYRVTRTIGSRYVQMYAGVQIDGPEDPGDPVHYREVKLPFAYWIERDEWFPQTYDETPDVPERDEAGELTPFYDVTSPPRTGEWRRSCALCHNTYPYAVRFDEVAQGKILGFPEDDIQLVTEPDEPRKPPRDERGASFLASWQIVTLGISCESCHFGAREHALEGASISFLPRGQDVVLGGFAEDDPRLAEPRQSPYVINSICAQCHTAKTQGPTYPHGGASWNSGEARDLRAGECASAIQCTDCHDPHEAGPVVDAMAAAPPDDPRHLAACTGCHEALAEPEAARAHSRHDDAVTCLDCHMPRIVHGLDGMIRSHRISSPSHPEMLAGEWPNACNLCHLDRSLSWTLDELGEGWDAQVDLPAGEADLEAPVGRRWLAHPEGVVRQVAADAYAGTADPKEAYPLILPLLDDPSPPTRMFARLAAERLLGRRLPLEAYRPWAAPAERAASIEALAELEPDPLEHTPSGGPADDAPAPP